MKIVKGLIGGALLLGMALMASAERGKHCGHRGHGGGDPLARLQSKLGLSEEQMTRLRPTFEQMKQRHQAQREGFKAHLKTVLTEQQLASLDKDGMRGLKLSDEQKASLKSYHESQRGSREQERKQLESQLQATLTAEQMTKFKEMKPHRGRHHH